MEHEVEVEQMRTRKGASATDPPSVRSCAIHCIAAVGVDRRIIETFRDEGVSGAKSRDERPSMKRLMQAVPARMEHEDCLGCALKLTGTGAGKCPHWS